MSLWTELSIWFLKMILCINSRKYLEANLKLSAQERLARTYKTHQDRHSNTFFDEQLEEYEQVLQNNVSSRIDLINYPVNLSYATESGSTMNIARRDVCMKFWSPIFLTNYG